MRLIDSVRGAFARIVACRDMTWGDLGERVVAWMLVVFVAGSAVVAAVCLIGGAW